MQFKYKSKLQDGTIQEGVIEATDKFTVTKQIRDRGELPILVSEVKTNSLLYILKNFTIGGRISLREKIMFTKNLSGMLEAGLAIHRALTIFLKQTTNKVFQKTLDSLINTISQGGTLSDGMVKSPQVFSPLFVAMIRAGEESGGLAQTLKEIGETLSKSYALNKKIKSAMTYPIVIIIAIIIIGVLMLIYVVPTLTSAFDSAGAELPASTQFIIWISDMLKNNIIAFLLIIFATIVSFIFLLKIPKVKKALSFISLRLPVVGRIIKEINTARTARTMSSLLKSGVSMSRVLNITKDVLSNLYYKDVMAKALIAIEKGENLSMIFKDNIDLYPIMMGEMVEVGEETGKLSEMLVDIADFYEGEVDSKTKDLSTIIEPVLMIFIGGAVGFFAISMISPMYSILDTIS